ncbi:MAG: threonine/serine exporter family protein [Kofleriaceae bacterium]
MPAMDESAVGFVLALGRALHRYGTPAHRLEQGLRNCCDRLGLEAELFTTPTTIIMSFGRPTELLTRMMRVDAGELDMGKLALVDALAEDVAAHRISPADGVIRLHEIQAAESQWNRPTGTVMGGISAASFAIFFGGGIADVILSGAIGLVLGLLAQYLARSIDQARVLEVVAAFFAAFVSGLVSSVWHAVDPAIVTVASLILFLPGLGLTIAMTELATRNPISGTARLMAAIVVLLELVVGVALGEKLADRLVEVSANAPMALPEWTKWVALLVASIGVAVVVQASVKQLGWILVACVVGYVGSRSGTEWIGPQMGVLVGAFALGVMSNVYARVMDRPAQVVQVPAVFLLVPGSVGFRGMTSLLDKDTLSGVETLFVMFVVALAIACGLLVASAVVPPKRSL